MRYALEFPSCNADEVRISFLQSFFLARMSVWGSEESVRHINIYEVTLHLINKWFSLPPPPPTTTLPKAKPILTLKTKSINLEARRDPAITNHVSTSGDGLSSQKLNEF